MLTLSPTWYLPTYTGVLPCVLFAACSYDLIGWERRFDSGHIADEAFLNASGCSSGLAKISMRPVSSLPHHLVPP